MGREGGGCWVAILCPGKSLNSIRETTGSYPSEARHQLCLSTSEPHAHELLPCTRCIEQA